MSSRDDPGYELAGEYVLGTLSGRDLEEFTADLDADYRLQAMVLEWQERLQPLAEALPPEEPPAHVWDSIAARLNIREQPLADRFASDRRRSQTYQLNERIEARRKYQSRKRELSAWRIFGPLATAASLLLAVALWQQKISPPLEVNYNAVSVVTSDQGQPLWIIDASISDRMLKIRSLSPPDIDDNKDYQLWLVKPNDGGVQSLGLLSESINSTVVVETNKLQADAVALAVSLEPAGGSPEQVPTGPVLYQGAFHIFKEKSI
ncbi:hypothetical protein AB833_03610 [Chromatiales bacterium (ex Bugula neritina AB1)]|nr:hypothetical protein AB833_03610 [Chromatiales bacterium (ex Bugula neritina AB1)]